ncbi:hypothetical protein Trydic_g14020 [Trypoxylus dichotomus]
MGDGCSTFAHGSPFLSDISTIRENQILESFYKILKKSSHEHRRGRECHTTPWRSHVDLEDINEVLRPKDEETVRRLLRRGNELRVVANTAAEYARVTGDREITPRGHPYRYGVVPRFAASMESVGSSVDAMPTAKNSTPRRGGFPIPAGRQLIETSDPIYYITNIKRLAN